MKKVQFMSVRFMRCRNRAWAGTGSNSWSLIQNPIMRGNSVHSSASHEISRHAGVGN